jgi:hypothetical protein
MSQSDSDRLGALRFETKSSDQYQRLMELKLHAEMLGAYGILLATAEPVSPTS